MITCMIVDDEPLATDVLRRYVESTPDLMLAGIFQKPMEAFAALQKQKIDLLFLDIQMPGLTGLELIRALRNPPKVILTTAFREFAVEGFELDVVDYLVKPVSKERFLKSVSKFTRISEPASLPHIEEEPFIFLKVEKEIRKLRFSEVLYVEALKNYARIKTTTRDLIVYYTLSYLEDKLPAGKFLRVHKSFIVNIDKIDHYTSSEFVIDKHKIPIGKTYTETAERIVGMFRI